MKLTTQEPLTVDGVALGSTRAQVDQILGLATTNANPAWARYYCQGGGPSGSQPLLVGYRPAWPQREAQQWQASSLCGSVLRLGDRVLVQVGESCQQVRDRLGVPAATFSNEPGFACLTYDGCTITFDELSGRVVEVGLRSATCAAEVPGAVAHFGGALAS